jgi:hypothetical protein
LSLVGACAGVLIVLGTPVAAQERFGFSGRDLFGTPAPATGAAQPDDSATSAPMLGLDGTRPEISWRVENAFRFFTDPSDTDLHRETFEALPPDDRRTPILSAERTLGRTFERGWAANLRGTTCWDGTRNIHRCPSGGDYVNPQSHAVLVRLTGHDERDDVRCVWRVFKADVRGQRGRSESVQTRPCHQAVRLTIPYPSGAVVTVSIGGAEIAAQSIKVEDLLIVGIGDSFGSGEGNPDFPVRFDRERSADYGPMGPDLVIAGYPARVGAWRALGDQFFEQENARWLDQACHRSLYSQQLRAALQLAIENPKRAVTFLHLACSGAEITRGLFLRYKGNEWVPDPPEHSQISSIAIAQCGERRTKVMELPEAYHMRGKVPDLRGGLLKLHECDRRRSRKIDLLFVSIGGNDIGFARLVANAVLRERSMLKRLGGWFGQVHGRREAERQLSELRERYRALKRALHYILHVPWNESDRVILTAYPPMALLEDGRSTCPSGKAGMEVFPGFYLNQRKATDSQSAADRLNAVMRKAARRHGWTFAEAHREDFIGRGLCAGFDEVSLSVADDLRFPRKINGRWVPYNPGDYRPYVPRQRWFRTPNDAYLTGHFHVTGQLLQGLMRNRDIYWTQVLLAALYSGAFHPTAEGHAAIADSVAAAARRVLERYAGNNVRN